MQRCDPTVMTSASDSFLLFFALNAKEAGRFCKKPLLGNDAAAFLADPEISPFDPVKGLLDLFDDMTVAAADQ